MNNNGQIRDKMFGMIGEITKKQISRGHFQDIPIGEKFLILNSVDLPAYSCLAIFPNYPPQIDRENGERLYQGYVYKNSYKIIGSIFENPEILND